MEKVKDILDKIISFNGDLIKLEEEYHQEISDYGYDNFYDVTNLSLEDIKVGLMKFINEEINYQQLYLWASILEVNEHILNEEKYEDLIYNVLYEISTPELYDEISKSRALEILKTIEIEFNK